MRGGRSSAAGMPPNMNMMDMMQNMMQNPAAMQSMQNMMQSVRLLRMFVAHVGGERPASSLRAMPTLSPLSVTWVQMMKPR